MRTSTEGRWVHTSFLPVTELTRRDRLVEKGRVLEISDLVQRPKAVYLTVVGEKEPRIISTAARYWVQDPGGVYTTRLEEP